jgi:hypothetical protein
MKMNLSAMQAARATAGSRYAAAVAELEASLVDLAALDAALSNHNIPAGGEQRTLKKLPESLAMLEHDEFAPSLRTRLADEVRVARDTYISGFAP